MLKYSSSVCNPGLLNPHFTLVKFFLFTSAVKLFFSSLLDHFDFVQFCSAVGERLNVCDLFLPRTGECDSTLSLCCLTLFILNDSCPILGKRSTIFVNFFYYYYNRYYYRLICGGSWKKPKPETVKIKPDEKPVFKSIVYHYHFV